MNVSAVKMMRQLEEENARLKKMVASISLENYAMKDLIQKSSDSCAEARLRRASRAGRNEQAAGM